MTIISQAKELNDVCLEIDELGRFSLDLEFIPEFTYDPELCLVQVGTDKNAYIIDPLVLDDLTPLWKRVADANILTVLHAGKQDLDLIFSLSNLIPQNIFDAQVAAGFIGLGYPIGYGKLVHLILGVQLSKTESYTTWNNRPLTKSQIEYALDDVRYLLPVYDKLVKQLADINRLSWVEEECNFYCQPETYLKDRSNSFFRIKGANSLSRKQLQVLKELDQWRHNEAVNLNRPYRSLLQDTLMIELAKRSPENAADLMRIRGLANSKKQWIDPLLKAVKAGLTVPENQCPQWIMDRLLSKNQLLLVDILFLALKLLCFEQEIAAELVATKKDLERLVYLAKEDNIDLALLQGWRNDLAGKYLLQLLKGETLSLTINEAEESVKVGIGSCHLERKDSN